MKDIILEIQIDLFLKTKTDYILKNKLQPRPINDVLIYLFYLEFLC